MRYVWDPFVRIFHWSLVIAFGVAFCTHESEWDRITHTNAGYVAGGLIVSRILWGFLCTGYAKFKSFPLNPEGAVRYAWKTLQGRSKPFVGHNPAGSLVIYLLLALGLITVISGFLVFNDGWLVDAPDLLHGVHFYSAWTWLGVVCLHVLGVITESIVHKDNLIVAMFTGVKNDAGSAVDPNDQENVSRETRRMFTLFGIPCRWVVKIFDKK